MFKKRKQDYLRSEIAAWVEMNFGAEYVEEVLEKYDKINSGIPIGGMEETIAFINMIETVKAQKTNLKPVKVHHYNGIRYNIEMYCPECMKLLKKKWKRCPKCGLDINWEEK